MMETFDKATYGFRFLSLSESGIQRLQELMIDVNLTVRQRESKLIVSFDLDERCNLDLLCKFISESGVDPTTYGVWISVIAELDRGGISLPLNILDVIRRTAGGVDFSFLTSP